MKSSDDQDLIKDFFQEMKSNDEQKSIPDFEELITVPRQKANWVPWIAASLALILVGWLLFPAENKTETVVIEMALTTTNHSSESLTAQEVSMFEWESPTQSLIDDF